jgi:hypothetical protein
MTVLIVLCSTGIGVGIALVVAGLFATTPVAKKMSFAKGIDTATRQSAAAALIGAAVVGLITQWPVGALIGAAVGWTLRSALSSVIPQSSDQSPRRVGHLDRNPA